MVAAVEVAADDPNVDRVRGESGRALLIQSALRARTLLTEVKKGKCDLEPQRGWAVTTSNQINIENGSSVRYVSSSQSCG